MKLANHTVLALTALAVASFPFVTQACNAHGHGHGHHHEQEPQDDHAMCADDDIPEGLSNTINGRRVESHFKVNGLDYKNREGYVAAGLRCRTAAPSEDQLKRIPSMLRKYKRLEGGRRLQTTFNIPIYFHIITETDGTGGVVSPEQIDAQVQYMNDAYAPDFSFSLSGTDTFANSDWYTATSGTPAELAMKTALKIGGTDTMNIYTLNPSDNSLGWVSCVVVLWCVLCAMDRW
jgi:hypothetical protein